jgi:hypothetical protein
MYLLTLQILQDVNITIPKIYFFGDIIKYNNRRPNVNALGRKLQFVVLSF